MNTLNHFEVKWSAPNNINAITTTIMGGVSKPPYSSNNIALHVGDNEADVLKNRQLLYESLNLTTTPIWLEQTHSTDCIVVEETDNRVADASITSTPNQALAIMTADCLPIIFCNAQGTEIAAVHAGWRGLVNGVVENTLAKMNTKGDNLHAWIGPAICHKCFEIGKDVETAFVNKYPNTQQAFNYIGNKYYANLAMIAEIILKSQGINSISQSNACTYELKNSFYSYRRMQQTGRIATLIWINN